MQDYTITQIQRLIREQVQRMQRKHQHWRKLQRLLVTGMPGVGNTEVSKMFPEVEAGFALRTLNVVLPNVTLIENSILAGDPNFLVTARGAGELYDFKDDEELAYLEENAQIGRAILGFYWGKKKVTRETNKAMRDCIRLGFGAVKVTWSSTMEKYTKTRDEEAAEKQEMIDNEILRAEALGDELAPYEEVTKGYEAKKQVYVRNEPVINHVSPFNIVVAPDAQDFDDAAWVAERIVRRKDLVETDPNYEDFFAVEGNVVSTAYNDEVSNLAANLTEEDSVFEYIELWEFWDQINKKVYHLQLFGKDFLQEGPIPWEHERSPYVKYTNYVADSDDFWGFGEIDNIAGLQVMLGEVVRTQVEDIRKAGNKYIIREDLATTKVRELLESTESDVIVPIELSAGDSLQNVIQPVPRLGAAKETWEAKGQFQDDIRTTMGLNEFQTGKSGADRMSATAVAAVDGNSTVRGMDKVRAYDYGNEQVGELILLLAKEYLDEKTAVRVGGANAGRWLLIEPGDLEGEYTVDVISGSTKAQNPAARAQKGNNLIQLLQQIDAYAQNPNVRGVLAQALRLMDIDPEATLPPVQVQEPQVPSAPGGPGSQEPGDALGVTGHPVDQLQALGAAPVPAATEGGIAL